MIFLCTDYRSSIYTGQVIAKIASVAHQTPVINLIDDLPQFNPRASSYLLNALVAHLPDLGVVLAVVDPGVGSDRASICFKYQSRWFVGPDNGIFSRILSGESANADIYEIDEVRLGDHAATFHGRDIFAPIAALLSTQQEVPLKSRIENSTTEYYAKLWPDDLAEIIYIDGYGNCITGLNDQSVSQSSTIMVGDEVITYAEKFSDVDRNTVFWYANSIGLVEIAVNQGSANSRYNLKIGTPVSVLVH